MMWSEVEVKVLDGLSMMVLDEVERQVHLTMQEEIEDVEKNNIKEWIVLEEIFGRVEVHPNILLANAVNILQNEVFIGDKLFW